MMLKFPGISCFEGSFFKPKRQKPAIITSVYKQDHNPWDIVQ